MTRTGVTALAASMLLGACAAGPEIRGTGDLGVVIERATGSVKLVEHSHDTVLGEVGELGDLSHAAIVFSRDERFAYVFGRDGGLTKLDLLTQKLAGRVMQAGNSIGGAISADGRLVAVANYEPGGIRVFDAETLAPVADIPTGSKVVGLEDAPGNRFVFSLYDKGEIWLADLSEPASPQITKFTGIGRQPYDALVTPDGRYYIAGLFGEDGLAMLDLWRSEAGIRRVLVGYGRGETALPVFKMPHLESWAVADGHAFIPAVGRHEVLVIDLATWTEAGRIPVEGQPVFVMARPDGRQLWVNFALPDNGVVQVIDVPSLKVVHRLEPGPGVLHLEFTPRGERVWLSVRDADQIKVYDTATFSLLATLPAEKPSGIFFTARAHRIGL